MLMLTQNYLIKKYQRRAARFVKHYNSRESSVTETTKEL